MIALRGVETVDVQRAKKGGGLSYMFIIPSCVLQVLLSGVKSPDNEKVVILILMVLWEDIQAAENIVD